MSTFEGQVTGWLMNAQPRVADDADCSDVVSALVAEHSGSLYRVAYSVTRNAAEAEDAVQETFLRVLRHRAKLSEVRDLRVWLVRIAWNIVLDKKRRLKTRPESEDLSTIERTLPSKHQRADTAVISTEAYRRILGLIDTLPRKEREALLLSAVEELTTAEIAVVLGTTESSVRSRIFRARRTLSVLLEEARP
jgi:RNA polymerase sigma-70 factor (ECF subfamily)